MEHRKLDAKLSEALADPPEGGRYEVFIELTPTATAADVDRLEQLGVTCRDAAGTIVTARVNAQVLSAVSDVPAVR